MTVTVLMTWGVAGGVLTGLAIVRVLGLLGLPVVTGTGSVLHRVFLP